MAGFDTLAILRESLSHAAQLQSMAGHAASLASQPLVVKLVGGGSSWVPVVMSSLLSFTGGAAIMALKNRWDDRRDERRLREEASIRVSAIADRVRDLRPLVESGAALEDEDLAWLRRRIEAMSPLLARLSVLTDRKYATLIYEWALLAEEAPAHLLMLGSAKADDPHLPPRAVLNSDHTISPMTISRGDYARERLDELENKGMKIGVAYNVFTDLSTKLVPGEYWPNARGRGSIDDIFSGPPIAPMPPAFRHVRQEVDADDPSLIHAMRRTSRVTWCGAAVNAEAKDGPIDRPRRCDRCRAELEAAGGLRGPRLP